MTICFRRCTLAGWIATALCLLACGRVRAQDPATLAESREVTSYAVSNIPATLAVSREITSYALSFTSVTQAVSRETTVFIPPGALSTLAVSREVTVFKGYTFKTAAQALRFAAGLAAITSQEMPFYDLTTGGGPPNVVNVADAVVIAQRAAHPPAP